MASLRRTSRRPLGEQTQVPSDDRVHSEPREAAVAPALSEARQTLAAVGVDDTEPAPRVLPTRRRRASLPGLGVQPPAPHGAPASPASWSSVADSAAESSHSKQPRASTRFWARLGWGLGAAFLLSVLAAGGVAVGLVRHYSEGLPSVAQLKEGYAPPQVTRVLARDDTLLTSVFVERRTVIAYEEVPDALKLAFLAAEDAHFFEHQGLNYWGIGRAMFANLRAGKMVQGGSTITQQVVKNVLLDSSRTFSRKLRELLLTRRLEQSLSKEEILWLYLNHIYLGHGRYGIEEAARYYFGKPAKSLLLHEAATLAGLVASPEHYSPRKHPKLALRRRAFVLEQMLKKGFVVPELYAQVKDRPLRLAPAEEAESKLVPEVVELAKREIRKLAPDEAESGGFTVHTTIDPQLQAAARAAVRRNIDDYMARHRLQPPYKEAKHPLWPQPFEGTPQRYRAYTGVVEDVDDAAGTIDVRVGALKGQVLLSEQPRYNPNRLKPSSFTRKGAALRVSFQELPEHGEPGRLRLELGPESALVAIDARSREVLALVGSYEAMAGALDRVTQMSRQPGSTFKAFVYGQGIRGRHLTAATRLPVSRRGHGVPEQGPLSISVRDAVAHSNNEAAQVALRHARPTAVVEFARALGITAPLQPDLSLALGSYEVTPLELANAYVAFANGGHGGSPRFFQRITGPQQKELAQSQPAAEAVMTSAEAFIVTSLLRSVVDEGTGQAARALGRDAAGKTGTTNKARDAWFVGYTTDLVAAVWVGYDDGLPLGRAESGARTALPAWVDFMKTAHAGRPLTRFARPPGVLSVVVDPVTGLLPAPSSETTRSELFLAGTEPTTVGEVEDMAATEITRDE